MLRCYWYDPINRANVFVAQKQSLREEQSINTSTETRPGRRSLGGRRQASPACRDQDLELKARRQEVYERIPPDLTRSRPRGELNP